MGKKLFLLVNLLLFAAVIQAAPVSKSEAQKKAQQFISGRLAAARGANVSIPDLQFEAADGDNYYVFNVGQRQGFVIVSGDDRTPEILGYSDEGEFDAENIPENMKAWLEEYIRQMNLMDETEGAAAREATPRRIMKRNIAPLLETTWDQVRPYYNECPTIGTNHTVTGCVATAMAQLMYYHRWPAQIKEKIPSYTCNTTWSGYGKISRPSVAAGTVINWDAMWTSYPYYSNDTSESSLSSQEQQANKAVADLMAYCGTSLKMEYRPSANGGSSASTYDAAQSLVKYFDYDATTRYVYRTKYSAAEWESLIYNELSEQRPVMYNGSSVSGGHAFIVDGYEDGYFHINWGWGGAYNCNVLLSVMNPYNNSETGASSTKDGYSTGQGAIIGAQKNIGGVISDECVVMSTGNIEIAGNTTLTRKSNGTFQASIHLESWNWTDDTHTFDVGLGIYDNQGTLLSVTPIVNNTSYRYTYGGKWDKNVDFSADLPDGNYRIMGISRLSNENEWHPNDKSVDRYIFATISGNKLKLMLPTISLTATEINIEGNLKANSMQHVVATIRNDGTDFNGYLYLLANGTAVAGKIFEAEGGKTAELDIEFMPDAAGDYTLSIATEKEDGSIIGDTSITITTDETATGTDNVDLTLSVTLNSAKVGSKNVILGKKIKATLTATNNTDQNYEGRCLLYRWVWVNGKGNAFANYKYLFVPAHSSTDVAFEYDVDFDGKYSVTPAYINNNTILRDDKELYQYYYPQPAVAYTDDNGEEHLMLAQSSLDVPADAKVVDLRNQNAVTTVDPSQASPNCLFLMDNDAQTPEGLAQNVVKGNTAEQVVLTDGYDFDAPLAFTATVIKYQRIFDQGTDARGGGWTTLVLPFDVETVDADGQPIDWFHNSSETGKQFWVMELVSDDGGTVIFRHTDAIRANTPYIIAVPGDTWGPQWDLRNKTITFTGSGNASLRKGISQALTGESYQFRGTMKQKDMTDIYALNATGSAFKLGDTTIDAFRAYFVSLGSKLYDHLSIYTGGSKTTGIIMPEKEPLTSGDIYAIDGRKVKGNLKKGVYIVNGKKMIK